MMHGHSFYYDGYYSGRFDGEGDYYCLTCMKHRFPNQWDEGKCWVCDSDLIQIAKTERLTVAQAEQIREELNLMANLNVLVERDAASYVNAVVQECRGEVGGLGYVRKLDNGDLLIYEFCLIEQEADGGGVEFDEKAMALFLEEASEREDFENLRLSWHSHGGMGVFYSGTDTGDAIEKYKQMGAPWLLSLVFNRKGEVKSRLDVFDSDAIDHVWLEDLKYRVVAPSQIEEQAKADVKAMVRPPTKTTQTKTNSKKNYTVVTNGRRKRYENGKLVEDEPVEDHKSRKQRKEERKRKERKLVAHSDFTLADAKQLGPAELDECLAYVEAHPKQGEHLNGKKMFAMSDREWLEFMESNGVEISEHDKAVLLGTSTPSGDDAEND